MRGLICIWTGAIADIPVGWAWCDGNNGTPDLRERYAVCAGDTYNPGDVGGSRFHTHDFTGDGHFHYIEQNETIDYGYGKFLRTLTVAITGTTDEQINSRRLRRYYVAFIMKL